ncbi:exonuclease subunit SbcD [Marinomonas algicola]|uniref:exonuclease subunit SbcD n=1 Tax=Marinomonas algicola TaxID=2773454 RepID=UPI00174E2991|nr:exonuclease subunit SbcD [Marinomonas algicola]
MKILHTSDWHLGQHFMGRTRQAEHKALIEWLLLQVQEHHIELIILAGDVFDTGAPPSYARELFNELVISLNQLSCQLIVVAGNHDSVSMLNESKNLLACLEANVIAKALPETISEHIIPVKNSHGQLEAVVCAVPFIRPKDLVTSKADQSETDKKRDLLNQIQAFYFEIYEAALKTEEQVSQGNDRREGDVEQDKDKLDDHVMEVQGNLFDLDIPIIGTGHLTTLGAKTSESVRDIYIGTLEAVPAQAFPPFDYLALGHIHRAQEVAGNDCQRYSGSPICLSFDELNREKSMVLLDTQTMLHLGKFKPKLLPIPTFQTMKTIRGEVSDVLQELKGLVASLENSDDNKTVWLEVKVITDAYLSDVQKHIQDIIQHSAIDLLRVTRQVKTQVIDHNNDAKETLSELSVEEVFDRCLAASTLGKMEQSQDEKNDSNEILELKKMFKTCVSSLQERDMAGNEGLGSVKHRVPSETEADVKRKPEP